MIMRDTSCLFLNVPFVFLALALCLSWSLFLVTMVMAWFLSLPFSVSACFLVHSFLCYHGNSSPPCYLLAPSLCQDECIYVCPHLYLKRLLIASVYAFLSRSLSRHPFLSVRPLSSFVCFCQLVCREAQHFTNRYLKKFLENHS